MTKNRHRLSIRFYQILMLKMLGEHFLIFCFLKEVKILSLTKTLYSSPNLPLNTVDGIINRMPRRVALIMDLLLQAVNVVATVWKRAIGFRVIQSCYAVVDVISIFYLVTKGMVVKYRKLHFDRVC